MGLNLYSYTIAPTKGSNSIMRHDPWDYTEGEYQMCSSVSMLTLYMNNYNMLPSETTSGRRCIGDLSQATGRRISAQGQASRTSTFFQENQIQDRKLRTSYF